LCKDSAKAQKASDEATLAGATPDFITPAYSQRIHTSIASPQTHPCPPSSLPAHLTPHPTNQIPTPDPLTHLLSGNLAYQKRTTARDPDAFTLLAQGQAPEILWIGYADSRIPETTVCHCKPGEIFVHRNIANTVPADDLSAASVVEYAVVHLKVKKVVVCGHTKCGGANAALSDVDLGGTLNAWLLPVRE
jgi:hypothetical protein